MDKVERYNKLLTSIYTDLMLYEIDRLKDGLMKDLTFHETHTIEIIGDMKEANMSQIAKIKSVRIAARIDRDNRRSQRILQKSRS